MSLNDTHLDELLNRPLPAIADKDFSRRALLRMRALHLRMQFLMWGLILLGLLPALIVLAYIGWSADWGIGLAHNTSQLLYSPNVSYSVGALVLAWVWKPHLFTR